MSSGVSSARWNQGWDEKATENGKTKIVHRPALKHVKENVGTTLNKALEAIEDANPDALQDVLKGINFNRKIGQRTLDDDTLADFVQNFKKFRSKMTTLNSRIRWALPTNG